MLLLGSAALACHAADWKAGVATVKITPEIPVPMAGYASRNKPFEEVEQDIYAKALAMDDGEGHRAIWVTTDLIGIARGISDPICARIHRPVAVMDRCLLQRLFGYLPSARVLKEGGYECRSLYNHRGLVCS